MDFKLKEGVNVNTYTFAKKVINEVIELMDVNTNFVDNDIYFYTQLVFLDEINENNNLFEILNVGPEKLFELMQNEVEPIFKEYVKEKEEFYDSYLNIVGNVSDYLYRQLENRSHISTIIYELLDDLGKLTPEQLIDTTTKVMNQILGIAIPKKSEKEDNDLKERVTSEISSKMKSLIEEYMDKEDTNE